MSLTKATGMVMILIAAIYIVIGIVNMGPSWSAAPTILDKSEVYGLNMDSTNVRFKIGGQLALEIIIAVVIGLVGWWLTTQDVRQLWYVYMLLAFIVVSMMVRSSPVLSIDTVRYSPAMAFYGAKVEFDSAGDFSGGWVTIPIDQNFRVGASAIYSDASQMGSTELVLDFSINPGALAQFASRGGKAKITGRVMGTRVIAQSNQVFIVPTIQVESAG
jgi:hypothetical protein